VSWRNFWIIGLLSCGINRISLPFCFLVILIRVLANRRWMGGAEAQERVWLFKHPKVELAQRCLYPILTALVVRCTFFSLFYMACGIVVFFCLWLLFNSLSFECISLPLYRFQGKRTNLSKSKLRKAWASLSQSVELVTALAIGHPSTNHLQKVGRFPV